MMNLALGISLFGLGLAFVLVTGALGGFPSWKHHAIRHVTCPETGKRTEIVGRFCAAHTVWLDVEACDRFGDEAVTCGRACLPPMNARVWEARIGRLPVQSG